MGDPKKARKKYSKPLQPWQKERIEEENPFVKKYGLKNKKELWKASSLLKKITRQAKKLVSLKNQQAEKEKKQLLSRLQRLGLLPLDSKYEEILNLKLNDILERRLQTFIFKLGFSRTVKQARQFITHHHVFINNKKVASPSYIVSQKEESLITFAPSSQFNNEDHPEMQEVPKNVKKEAKQAERLEKNKNKYRKRSNKQDGNKRKKK